MMLPWTPLKTLCRWSPGGSRIPSQPAIGSPRQGRQRPCPARTPSWFFCEMYRIKNIKQSYIFTCRKQVRTVRVVVVERGLKFACSLKLQFIWYFGFRYSRLGGIPDVDCTFLPKFGFLTSLWSGSKNPALSMPLKVSILLLSPKKVIPCLILWSLNKVCSFFKPRRREYDVGVP